jgi:uncharacterized protein (DUF1015 family)
VARLEPVAARLISPEWVQRVPSPAHDSLSPEARRRHVALNPDSYLTVTRAPDDLPTGTRWDLREVLASSQASLDRLLDAGAFGELGAPALYLYRLTLGDHSQTGIVGLVATEDYDRGVIRVHERHVDARAQLLADHLAALQVQSSPIALAHRPHGTVTAVVSQATASTAPLLDFRSSDGLRQQLWLLEDRAAAGRLRDALADVPLYLIDGHHRAAAMSRYRAASGSPGAEWMLGALFADDQLQNQAFHRHLHGIDLARLLAELGRRYVVRHVAPVSDVAGRRPDELALLAGSRWHLLRLPYPARPASARALLNLLDPTRLQHHVLGPLLGIDGSAGPGANLTYLPGLGDEADLVRLAGAGRDGVWVMRPVPVATLLAVADAGLVMPPKSTYFVPKVRAGVFLRHLS